MSFQRRFPLVAGLVLVAALAAFLASHRSAEHALHPAEASNTPGLDGLHLPWLANAGQADGEVDFYARTRAGTVFITRSGDVVHAFPERHGNGVALRESFVGGTPVKRVGCDRSAARIHSYAGRDPAAWRTDIEAYDRVRLPGVYDGVDVDLVARALGVEKLFRVAPGKDPTAIRVRVEGAQAIETTPAGDLELTTAAGTVTVSRPVAYQERGAHRDHLVAAYDIDGDTYGFTVRGRDPTRELVIDPILEATFLGGTGNNPETAWAVVVDSAGNVYVAGQTPSPDFPTTFGTYRGGGYDAFIGKLSADLSTLVAGTFLGGGATDQGIALALWQDTSLFVGGETDSGGITNAPKFPTTAGAFQEEIALIPGIGSIPQDCFVAKLHTDTLMIDAATYFGGRRPETFYALALDGDGNVFLAGVTQASETTGTNGQFFPVLGNGYDHTYNGSSDVFVAKLSNDLETGLASTYLGGTGNDTGRVIAVDADGDVLVGGETSSTDFPAGATLGTTGGFLARFSNDLSTLEGAVLTDRVRGIAVGEDDIILALRADDDAFPATAGAFDESYSGAADIVVARVASDFSVVLAATYLGGSDNDFTGSYRAGIAMDSHGGIVIGGWTASDDFPTTRAAYARSFIGGTYDAFIARLSHDLTALDYSTYFGGTENESLQALVIDGDDNAVAVGDTFSADFPVSPTAYQVESNINLNPPSGSPGNDPYIARLMTRDGDDDGVIDAEEMGPAGDDPAYDGNDDGTPDHEQAHVCSFFTYDGGNYVTIECPATSRLIDVEAIETPLANAPPALEFRYDLARFCVTVPNPGDSVDVTLHLPASPNSYWKYGKTAADPVDHWYRFTGAQISGNKVTLTLVDGGAGDSDLAADGKVTDPGGPAFATTTTPPTTTNGDDDCLMAVAARGSWLDGDLQVLREFRDDWLLTHALGRAVTAFYYRHSPAIAAYLEAHPAARVAMRWALVPLVYGVKYPWAAVALLAWCVWRRKRRRSHGRTSIGYCSPALQG